MYDDGKFEARRQALREIGMPDSRTGKKGNAHLSGRLVAYAYGSRPDLVDSLRAGRWRIGFYLRIELVFRNTDISSRNIGHYRTNFARLATALLAEAGPISDKAPLTLVRGRIPGMKLVIITANWPHPAHSVRATNVVVFELARALAAQGDFTVGLLKAGHENDPEIGADERAGIDQLERNGVEILPPLRLPAVIPKGSRFAKFMAPKPEHFYPDVANGSRIAAALAHWRADALLVPWSEWLTAACVNIPVLRFAYYGNPDHKTGRCRAEHDRRLGGSLAHYARLRVGLGRLEHAHLGIMRRYHLLGDVAANDAAYYAASGHPDAFYIRNIWIDRFGEGWRARRDAAEQDRPLVIIGNVGKLDATANRYGLEYLGRDVLPALRRRMAPGSFRIDILGAGMLHPKIARLLDVPEVVIRGFVPDIDQAILSAPVFLCANNASPFKVCHTRYLHAWTLGACVVAHRDVALSIPEMADGENALLGADAEGMADAVARAAADPALRRRIGEGGWETYRAKFRAEGVAAEIAQRLRKAAATMPAGQAAV